MIINFEIEASPIPPRWGRANQLCITTAKMAAIDREKGYVEH